MNNILVPLDGSELAESALPYALTFAEGFGSSLRLLNAVDTSRVGFFDEEYMESAEFWAAINDAKEQYQTAAAGYLQTQSDRLGELGFSAETVVDEGHPADLILEHAENNPVDLIAMATHGRSGLGRFVLGSVASRVLRHSRVPLLVVRPQEETSDAVANLTDIIIPLNTSELSKAVLPLARRIATTLNLDVTLVAVVPRPSQVYVGTEVVMHVSDALDELQNRLRIYLQDMAEEITVEDKLKVDWQVLRGDPGTEIVDFARDEFDNNLIAMSTHGRAGLGRWLIGSATDKVVRTSGDPVLVVRPEQA